MPNAVISHYRTYVIIIIGCPETYFMKKSRNYFTNIILSEDIDTFTLLKSSIEQKVLTRKIFFTDVIASFVPPTKKVERISQNLNESLRTCLHHILSPVFN